MLNKNVPNNKTYSQGNYANEIKNPNKYIGNLNKIYYRSSQEKKFCIYCDNDSSILKQGVECIEIPYQIPNEKVYENGRKGIVVENRRYYPDFYVEIKKGDSFERLLLEIKPHKQTLPPNQPKQLNNKKQLTRYNIEYDNQRKNMIKQKFANEYCVKMGIKFKILTEANFKFK